MKKEDELASYLMHLGEEVYKLLLSKRAKKEDAEDIIQNTIYKVYMLLGTLNESNLRPWFFRVALNEYIDLKRKKDEQTASLTEEIYVKLQHANNAFDVINHKDEITYLLKDTKQEYREIFLLKYYYDLTYEEIAQILHIQSDSVKQKLYRARKSIQCQNVEG
ncbi:RNA polymerase sigma factor [Bacillus ndiopicus]|uniref:RNA polymerase sigma factor n=1 Tax=Bacillus ndiopicus TaxID=1347368 RepID=UPI0005A77952|nr:sigma-70 family RNA polymerase sigma factor [Bacillus ndiopicus]